MAKIAVNINSLSPYIRVATLSREKNPFSIRPRIILDYEIIMLEEGAVDIEYLGKIFKAYPGDILFFRPGIVHSLTLQSEYISQPHIHFDVYYDEWSEMVYVCFKTPDELDDKDKTMLRKDIFFGFEQPSPIIKITDKDRFSALFKEAISIFTYKPPLHEMYLKSKMTEMLIMIIEDNFPDFVSLNSTNSSLDIQLVKNYLNKNFRSNPTLEELSQIFMFNKYYIVRQFKDKFGVSPIKYCNQLRISEAKKLLTAYSVTDVSAMLGYGSIYIFSRAFKNSVGITPLEWKNKSKLL